MIKFELDERLAADTLPIADLPLSRVLLMNDARYPWVVLVPRQISISEVFELHSNDPGGDPWWPYHQGEVHALVAHRYRFVTVQR